LILQR
jgi:hypothetical protein